jgi:hypothetical protein
MACKILTYMFNIEHCVQLQDTKILSTKYQMIREVTVTELHHSKKNNEMLHK